MNENDVRRYISALHDLSTLPMLLGKIVHTCNDPKATPAEVYNLIAIDPALAERVLRIANSVFLGHSGLIKNIYQAIMFLGFERIKSLALGMTVLNAFPTRGSSTAENLWIHSYEVAYLSSLLAEYVPMTLPSECFLAGLLHDMGRIVFYGMDQKGFVQIETGDSMFEQERGLSVARIRSQVPGLWKRSACPPSSWLPLNTITGHLSQTPLTSKWESSPSRKQ
jgi:HD-like signal output (HDOD) protein